MRLSLIAALGLSSLTAACGGGTTSGDDEQPVNCATETRGDAFHTDLEKMGEGSKVDFTLVSADPAPPMRDDNAWIIRLNSVTGGVAGDPMTGATIRVTPYMPDHQHVSPTTVTITAMPEAGQYKLDPVNFWMPGLWETTISVTSGDTTDKAVYRFCIPN